MGLFLKFVDKSSYLLIVLEAVATPRSFVYRAQRRRVMIELSLDWLQSDWVGGVLVIVVFVSVAFQVSAIVLYEKSFDWEAKKFPLGGEEW